MNKPAAKREKTSVSLLPDAIRLIKKAAYERDEQFNEIIEQAVFALWGDQPYPQRDTLGPVPKRDTTVDHGAVVSMRPSQLSELRNALNQAIAVIDGVLTDGEDNADKLGSIKAELERTLADGGNPGTNSPDAAPSRVTATKGRRAR